MGPDGVVVPVPAFAPVVRHVGVTVGVYQRARTEQGDVLPGSAPACPLVDEAELDGAVRIETVHGGVVAALVYRQPLGYFSQRLDVPLDALAIERVRVADVGWWVLEPGFVEVGGTVVEESREVRHRQADEAVVRALVVDRGLGELAQVV